LYIKDQAQRDQNETLGLDSEGMGSVQEQFSINLRTKSSWQ